MTEYYSVILTGSQCETRLHHQDEEEAEHLEYRLRAEGYKSVSFGDINGEGYTVVYYRDEDQMRLDFVEDYNVLNH